MMALIIGLLLARWCDAWTTKTGGSDGALAAAAAARTEWSSSSAAAAVARPRKRRPSSQLFHGATGGGDGPSGGSWFQQSFPMKFPWEEASGSSVERSPERSPEPKSDADLHEEEPQGSNTTQLYYNRARLLEGMLQAKVKQLRKINNRVLLLEDILAKLNDKHKNKIHNLTHTIDALSNDKHQLTHQLETIQTLNNQTVNATLLQSQLEQLLDDNYELEQLYQQLQSQNLSQIKQHNQKQHQLHQQHQHQIHQLQQQLQQALQSQQEKHEQTQQEWDIQKEDLLQTIHQFQHQNKTLQENIMIAQSSVDASQLREHELLCTIQELESELDEISNASNNKNNNQDLEQEIMFKSNNELMQQQQLQQYKDTIAKLNHEIQILKNDKHQLQLDVEQLETKNKHEWELRHDIENQFKRIQNESLQWHQQQGQQEQQQKQKQMEQQQQLYKYQEQQHRLQADLTSLQSEFNIVSQQNQGLKNEMEELHNQILELTTSSSSSSSTSSSTSSFFSPRKHDKSMDANKQQTISQGNFRNRYYQSLLQYWILFGECREESDY